MIPFKRYPINGTFELTLRCNLRCKMCMFRHADSENPRLIAGELTAEQWADMAQQVADAGTVSLLLTGGEPMVRKDFIQVYEGIYQKGFLLTLYTNATLVTPEILKTLRKMPPHRIGVTLYGASNADYEKICGCKDGFDRAMEGLTQLLTLPSAMEVRMTLIQDNYHQAETIEKLIMDRFGLPVTHTSFVYKSVRGGCMHPEDCRMTPQQMVDLTYDRAMEQLRAKIPEEVRPFLKVKVAESTCPEGKEHATLMGCNAGIDSYTLTWDGKLQGCQMLDAFCVDARTIGFQKAWEQYPAAVRIPEPEEECRNCEFAADCQVCPAVAMAETGKLQGNSPYICQFTKLTRKKKEELQL